MKFKEGDIIKLKQPKQEQGKWSAEYVDIDFVFAYYKKDGGHQDAMVYEMSSYLKGERQPNLSINSRAFWYSTGRHVLIETNEI